MTLSWMLSGVEYFGPSPNLRTDTFKGDLNNTFGTHGETLRIIFRLYFKWTERKKRNQLLLHTQNEIRRLQKVEK
jgi:hypothetical protein